MPHPRSSSALAELDCGVSHTRNHWLVNIRSLFFPFTFLLNGISLVLILWLGGLRVIDGALTMGSFVAFNAYLIRTGRPTMMLGRMMTEYQRAVASLRRIEAMLAEPRAQHRQQHPIGRYYPVTGAH